jgi:cation diffusion facilitator CzcD-associated flavoprotein CzcO
MKHRVINFRQIQNDRWQVNFENLITNETESKSFDFLIMSNGLECAPIMPQYTLDSNPKFKGLIMHSAQFRMNDPRLKDKRVIIVGNSHSGCDIASKLVGHAGHVTSIFSRTYLVSPRLIRLRVGPNKYRLGTIVELFFTLHTWDILKNAEKKDLNDFLRQVFPYQTNKSKSHADLYFDLDDPNSKLLVSVSDGYLDACRDGLIVPKKGEIEELEERGVRMKDGSFYEADVLLYCTGYQAALDCIDRTLYEKIVVEKTCQGKPKLALYKMTFNPEARNFAACGIIERFNMVK